MIYISERKHQSHFDAQKAYRLTMQSTKIAINCQLKRQITINFYFLNKKLPKTPFFFFFSFDFYHHVISITSFVNGSGIHQA